MRIEKEVIQKLKTETKNNPAANPVFHLLALRRRTRGTITLGALAQKMRREGFEYTNDQYRELLNTMAVAGVGSPVVNRVGNVVGIKNIKVNLAALGKAALDAKELEALGVIAEAPKARRTNDRRIAIKPLRGYAEVRIKNSSLDVSINGTEAIIQFPKGLSAGELTSLLEKLQGRDL